MVVAVLLFQGACQGQQRFAGARDAANGDKVDVGVLDGVQGKGLFCVPWLDAVGVRFVDALDVPTFLIEEPHGAGRAVLQNVEVVVLPILTKGGDLSAVPVDVHAADDVAVDAFQGGSASEHVPIVLDLARLVIFRRKVQGLGLESQVDVLGHQNDLRIGFIRLQTKCGVQDLVVVRAFCEDVAGVGILAPRIHDNFQFATQSIFQWNPVLEGVGVTQFVQNANARTGFEVFGFVAHFEAIELFEHRDGQGDFILFEVGEGRVVKQQHTRVQDKDFGLDGGLFVSGGRCLRAA